MASAGYHCSGAPQLASKSKLNRPARYPWSTQAECLRLSMTRIPAITDRFCPKCRSDVDVRPKILTIGLRTATEERGGYTRPDQLAANECLPVEGFFGPSEQFVRGLYCEKCGIGFVPNDLIRTDVLAEINRRHSPLRDELQTFEAVIWQHTQDSPGLRITFVARDLGDAQEILKREYGENLIFTLYNKTCAERTR